MAERLKVLQREAEGSGDSLELMFRGKGANSPREQKPTVPSQETEMKDGSKGQVKAVAEVVTESRNVYVRYGKITVILQIFDVCVKISVASECEAFGVVKISASVDAVVIAQCVFRI